MREISKLSTYFPYFAFPDEREKLSPRESAWAFRRSLLDAVLPMVFTPSTGEQKTSDEPEINERQAAFAAMTIDPHHFEFNLDLGIRNQVVDKLISSPLLSLTRGVGPQASGIYALYFKGELIYVGKASKGTTRSKRTLRARLNEHVIKIEKRQNISLTDVMCRFLTFDSEWWVFAAEFALMSHYAPEWNETGFGSKTPGVGRPGTDRVSRWDTQFPLKS